jgi:hypothetical protein
MDLSTSLNYSLVLLIIQLMTQLSPFAQFIIDEIRDICKDDCIPDHILVNTLADVLLTDNVPPHVLAIVKELQAHLT